MPSADDSLSTTRITLPARMPRDVRKVDQYRLRTEQPHWPLIVMTVLTQLSAGAFTSIWLLEILSARIHRSASLVALCVAVLALCASTLHLGRPIHAMRALKMWRRSWLSREVLMFTLFAGAATAYSLTLWLGLSASVLLGGLRLCSDWQAFTQALACTSFRAARHGTLPSRSRTFFLPRPAGLCRRKYPDSTHPLSRDRPQLISGLATLLAAGSKLLWLEQSSVHELRGTFRLLTTVLSGRSFMSHFGTDHGLVLLQFAHTRWTAIPVAFALIAGEFIDRYLFFVSVVPTNMATEYLAAEAA